MATIEDTFTSALAVVRSAATSLPGGVHAVRPLSDADLLDAQRTLADTRRALDAAASLVAGEMSHRSRGELGYDGLAQRAGFQSAEKLVQHTTGSTAREAFGLVAVGTLVHNADAVDRGEVVAAELSTPWLAAVGTAVAAGGLSIAAAQAIRVGLGEPSLGVAVEALSAAVAGLIIEARVLDADRLLLRARAVRNELDAAGVADRERQIYHDRSIRRLRRPNGVSRYIVDPDLESAAYWDDLFDKLISPRRNGPRFVTEAEKSWAKAIADDPRTDEQYLFDAVTQLVRIGVAAERENIVGSRQPSVRVLVTAGDRARPDGIGRIEGTAMPVSIASVERNACAHGTIDVAFDSTGHPLDVGREQRFFTARQRIALAARDGGCCFGDCDKPPSWTEAHHVKHWKRDRGRTDIADGILLCRFHHLLVHNNGWDITRDDDGFWLTPPPGQLPEHLRQPQLMRSRSAALYDLLARG